MKCIVCKNIIKDTMPEELKNYNKPIRKRQKCYICSPYRDRHASKSPEEIAVFRAKRVEAVQRRRDKLKLMAVDYKGGKCIKCGYNKCVNALEFHHLDDKTKDFAIGSKGYTRSWEAIKEELDKCVLLCANCYREEHFELTNYGC